MHVAPTRSADHGTDRARPDARAVCYLMGQVLAFGGKSGIEPPHLDMVMQTMSSHPGLQEYATRMRERRFDDVGFDLLGGLKTCSRSSMRRPRPASRSRLRMSSGTGFSPRSRTVWVPRT